MATPVPFHANAVVGGFASSNYQDLTINLPSNTADAVLCLYACNWHDNTYFPISAAVGNPAGTMVNIPNSTTMQYGGWAQLSGKAFWLQGSSLPTGAGQTLRVQIDPAAAGSSKVIINAFVYTGVSGDPGAPIFVDRRLANPVFTMTTIAGSMMALLSHWDAGLAGTTTAPGTERFELASVFNMYSADKVAVGTSTSIDITFTPTTPIPNLLGFAWNLPAAASPPSAVVVTSAPSTANTGAASSNIVVNLDQPLTTGSVIVTPGGGGAGAVFTPTSATAVPGNQTLTFTYTPATNIIGVQSITFANNAGLTNPAPTTITVLDSIRPTLTGTLTASAITQNSYTLSWTAGSDNIAVASHELSFNAGGTWTDLLSAATTTNVAGRTPGSTDQCQVRAKDAAGNVSLSPIAVNVTLLAASDSTPPTLTGAISITSPTPTGYVINHPAGSDNVAVVGYDHSLDGGATWASHGLNLSVAITGRTQGATDQIRVRARDATPNYSSPPLSTAFTLPTTLMTSDVMSNNAGSVWANTNVVYTYMYNGTIGNTSAANMISGAAITNSLGQLVLSGILPIGVGDLWVKIGNRIFFQSVTVV